MKEAIRQYNEAVHLHNKNDYGKALMLFRMAANRGLAEAQVFLGIYYDNGYAVRPDKAMAFSYYMMAAQQGNAMGQANAGLCYLMGNGTQQDYERAVSWLQRAAQKDNATACYNLGTCYESGKGVSVNKQTALDWYKRAADLGSKPGSTHYMRLKQELENPKEEQKLPEEDPLEEAKRLNREGQALYRKKNYAGAFLKYLRAAQLGFPPAMHNVGACYQVGEGTEKNPERAFYWVSRGAAEDHNSSIARLGWLHASGIGTPVDLQMAIRLYEKSAERGSGLACNNLAVLYQQGKGVLVDKEKALELFEKAVALDNNAAKENLARLQEKLNWPEPQALPENPEEALELFRQGMKMDRQKRFTESCPLYLKSARMGNADAMFNLACAYYNGEGTAQNYDLAVFWFRKSAEQGNGKAWCNLAICYRKGNGVVEDRERALNLYKKAADLGEEKGRENYNMLYEEIYGQPPYMGDLPVDTVYPPQPPKAEQPAGGHTKLFVSAREELENLIGLESVKRDIKEMVSLVNYQRKRQAQGKKTSPVSMHMVFTGNPGTGKTTVARLIARLYYEMGILSKDTIVEVDRSQLVGEYVGHTAKKTSDVIQKAMGGVLFIDEAYSLAKNSDEKDFGHEAIDTLLKAMEDNRENLMVIVAGYTAQMHRFITSNPGLQSRFKKFIEFEDYNGPQLKEIFLKMAVADEYTVDRDALELAGRHFDTLYRTRDSRFGNGRVVRNFYQDVLMKLAYRSTTTGIMGQERIMREDVEAVCGMVNHSEGKPAMDGLNKLIGLESVKKEIDDLVQLAKYRKLCLDAGLDAPAVSMHMVFSGNPGTGKTTVARLLGRIYHELGLLTKPNCLEVDRSALVAEYVGQTATKTMEILERAVGGVLFIDEAYTLAKSNSANDFGHEAIETILKFMEDNRESLVVIVAGYSQEMRNFIGSNPGLQSRFTKVIHFEDYNPGELEQIFYSFAKDYSFSEDAQKELAAAFEWMAERKGAAFGNGREVRTFYEAVVTRLAYRIASNPDSGADLKRITGADIRQVRENWEKKAGAVPKKPPKIGFI